MFWLTIAGTVVAVLRLVLILLGLCITVQLVSNRFNLACCSREMRRKSFFGSNILYLLGLVPHALLILSNISPFTRESNVVAKRYDLQDNTFCWSQRLFCAAAAGIHLTLYGSRISEKVMTTFRVWGHLKQRLIVYVVMPCYVILATIQSYWLWPEKYTKRWTSTQDDLNHPKCTQFSELFGTWTDFLALNSNQTVQVQLLLCEERMGRTLVTKYLAFCIVLVLPTLLYLILPKLLPTIYSRYRTMDENGNIEVKCRRQCPCSQEDPRLDGVMNRLSSVITLWVLCLRPLAVSLFSVFSDYFVDLGTHLLLTLCVIVPVTVATKTESISKETNDNVCDL